MPAVPITVRPARDRELDRGDADAAAGAVNEHGVAGRALARPNSARQAVTYGTNSPAPCGKLMRGGSRCTWPGSHTASAA